ncbi:PAS domain S-box [anaerobic digester metagenome]|jgi:signal transduction histidine kinase|uniref:PAS domain S-box n=1 Tax=anaerobic digester metagenome TaxID=1263854 RepID=A0A485M1G6_9ZZZZ
MVESPVDWLQLVFNHLPLGIIVIDRRGHVRLFNNRLSMLTGYQEERILGKPFSDLINNPDSDYNKLLQTLATGKEYQNLKPESVILLNAPFSDFRANTYAIKDKGGATVGAMALLEPAGRQQELENAVIKAEKLAILGQLATEMIHELRNPLTAISGFVQLLQQKIGRNSELEYLDIISNELKHLNRLISDFLLQAKPGYCSRTQCSINKLLTDVAALVECEASLRNLKINLETPEDPPPIKADSGQLRQVFLNIIRNAFDALPDEGQLFLQCSGDKQLGIVRVVIRDTGKGMDGQIMANMFKPFFTTKESGTGLGMFISKKIIDNHGGSIDIQSEPARGTTVTVTLPVA